MNDTFGKRFKSLRIEKGITQDELVKQFNEKYFYNFTKSSISMYENDKQVPEVDVLKKWAEFFQVGLDFLLGNSDIRNPYKESPEKTDEDIDLWLSKTDGYKELPEEDRLKIIEYAKFMLEKHKKPESK